MERSGWVLRWPCQAPAVPRGCWVGRLATGLQVCVSAQDLGVGGAAGLPPLQASGLLPLLFHASRLPHQS